MINFFKKKKRCNKSMKSLIDSEADRYKKEAKEATKKLLELFETTQKQQAV